MSKCQSCKNDARFETRFEGNFRSLVIQSDLFGMVKTWPFGKVKWPPTRESKGHFESPGGCFMNFLFFYHFFSPPPKKSQVICIVFLLPYGVRQFGGALRLPRPSFSLRLWLAIGSKQYTVYILYCNKFCIVRYILCLILWSHIRVRYHTYSQINCMWLFTIKILFNYVDIIQNIFFKILH